MERQQLPECEMGDSSSCGGKFQHTSDLRCCMFKLACLQGTWTYVNIKVCSVVPCLARHHSLYCHVVVVVEYTN